MGYYGLEKIGYSTAFYVRFFDGGAEGKCFGGEILMKIYDKTKRNPSFFKEFLKDQSSRRPTTNKKSLEKLFFKRFFVSGHMLTTKG